MIVGFLSPGIIDPIWWPLVSRWVFRVGVSFGLFRWGEVVGLLPTREAGNRCVAVQKEILLAIPSETIPPTHCHCVYGASAHQASFSVPPNTCLFPSGHGCSLHPITMFGSTLVKQGQAKPDIVANYISGLRSYHVKHNMSVEVFDNPLLEWITNEETDFFLK